MMNFILLLVGILFIFLICKYYYKSSKQFNKLMAILLFGIIVGAGISLAKDKIAKLNNTKENVEVKKANPTTQSGITSFVENVITNYNFESTIPVSCDNNFNYFLIAPVLIGNTVTEYINDS